MRFEIDVSGEDIFDKNYAICVSDNLIKGFKFNERIIKTLRARRGEGKYRYPLSEKGKGFFKVRLYCIIVYYLFKDINLPKNQEIILEVCRDFKGHEREITSNLKYFLEILLELRLNLRYIRLPKDSNADKYAALMRNDTKNKLNYYVEISLENIERFFRKKF